MKEVKKMFITIDNHIINIEEIRNIVIRSMGYGKSVINIYFKNGDSVATNVYKDAEIEKAIKELNNILTNYKREEK